LIQAFEFTHELAWNTLKDFLEELGSEKIYGSKDATRAAFKAELIKNGEAWMRMINSRNLTSHTYDEAITADIVSAIRAIYFAEFETLQLNLAELKKKEEK
jgi:nucleotidyltransferase substrate binding protein (TIGR01987 family)